MKRLCTLLFCTLCTLPAIAADKVSVLALFADKAMLGINGKNHLLGIGESSPEGIRLISANPRMAVIEIDGQQRQLKPGGTVQSNYAPRAVREMHISRNNQGAYSAHGSINGRAVSFLVDTGASSVAMSAKTARRLGIPYRLTGRPARIHTASGQVEGYQVDLDKVQLGELVLRDVQGVVIEADAPAQVLLGMSFLNRLDMRNSGNIMVLRSR